MNLPFLEERLDIKLETSKHICLVKVRDLEIQISVENRNSQWD